MTADETIEEDVQAGVSIQIEPANDLIEIRVITLGNVDHVDVVGDPADHFDPAELSATDFRGLEVGDTLEIEAHELESDGKAGRVTAVAVADDRETVVTSEEYDFT